uniref:Sugar phosphate transporter domain-containing protein n=2 Tax=Rhodosorus marinus TaxID=101924 RepID=A0A7S3A1D0_9RHOD|mmetsp:Transcript_38486/g.151886  ORF Transcript_38486/g.151886 Transcript_38486/m.151886 type:complete len:343 (+) Transcript_38486:153-1181(+)|eukprot:CAMPEP_0113956150 /NCGR_PEP_ID=MMETSP0011_2-20120614/1870_1 /TAXON_ID=101924 /ORGANISM="Rhodosorus marinus" /LENGTH=342 /DNA_ID=CAMNT_0000966201 /DNA_START=23 /DNA_END=1051 /DNA_ORIENTATION=- /assembly_acc=CAM_ASM_000156
MPLKGHDRASAGERHPIRGKVVVGFFIAAWITSSVVSLFLANSLLKGAEIGEDVFTVWQLACSIMYGLLGTKVLRLHRLSELSRKQVRAIVPLSIAYLVKELLKYASLGRVSVNLFNTIRSLGPMFSITLEILFFKHYPTGGILLALLPIVLGVTATSIDEMHASLQTSGIFVQGLGLVAAIASTAINNAQNIYSKVLFGQKRIDPFSLQIYLSAISLLMIIPCKVTTSLSVGGVSNVQQMFFPSRSTSLMLLLCGFINFLSSQLAFSTLHMISPVSYSVSNTFKRIIITGTAVTMFGERLSILNGLGIATSIVGVFFYERAVRSYKQAKLYETGHETKTIV